MTPERWRQIEELYHAARERGTEALAQSDPELRRAVEVLLAQDGGGEKILDRPASDLLADVTMTQLTAGAQLGPYKIERVLGAGGMGEVFEAIDTRLGRKIAIKVCAEQFSGRFEREARAISSLNHPHICTLHDIGPNYLVMELVEGDTLAARLKKGALSIELVLQYGAQIADALAAAHAKAIVHRDLKPGNIMLTKNGVKVLDFGLAKSSQDETITGSRVVMGTPAYMAPEQYEGKECDARSDIFSLGLVLYEMSKGKRAPQDQPASMEGLPERFAHVIERCLARDPDSRWQSAADVKAELEWAGKDQVQTPVPRAKKSLWVVQSAAVVFGAVLLGALLIHFRQAGGEAHPLRFTVPAPERAMFETNSLPAVSPDGRHLAFVASVDGKSELWVRDLDSVSARALAGTEGASYPFWSPDNRLVGFFAGGKVKKIDVAGGPALSLCDVVGAWSGSWNKNDVIIFAAVSLGVFRVPAAGGMPVAVTVLAPGESAHRFPWFLPDGRHFLFTVTDREKYLVYVGDLDSKDRKLVLPFATNAAYSPPRDVLFVREGTLMAQPFDASRLQTTGDAIPVAEQVDTSFGRTGQSQYAVSQNGVLVYSSGSNGFGGTAQLTWFDRSGRILGTVGPPGLVQRPAISPDGNTVVVDRKDPQTGLWNLWLHDLTRGTASRFTFNSRINMYPVWSPDGSHIAFSSSRDGGPGFDVYQKAVSGASQDAALQTVPSGTKIPLDWSSDGRYIIETVIDPKTNRDTWLLPLFGDRKPVPYLQTVFEERNARLSPNGQWLAYTSDESRSDEVYVQTFPKPGGKWQVSTNGGGFPIWSRDGKELFFIGADGKLMVAEVKAGSNFEASVPRPLFDSHFIRLQSTWYDVSKDGRFLIPTQTESVPMTVVINWTAGLRK